MNWRKANLTLIGRAKGKKFIILSGEKELNEKNVVGMILAGGLSRRMGEDKSQKKILGKSLIELVIRRSKKQVQTLIINSNDIHK